MKNVKIDLEELKVTTEVSLSATYKELEDFYKGNDQVLNHTFPLLALKEANSTHKKRFVGEEDGLHYYTFYPWKMVLTRIKDE